MIDILARENSFRTHLYNYDERSATKNKEVKASIWQIFIN
jgi:hypothetical protein